MWIPIGCNADPDPGGQKLPEFTQISNQTFTWINNGNITTKYCIYEFVTNLNFFLLSRIGN